MFETISVEIADRLLSGQRTVKLASDLEQAAETVLASTCKGLAFVQLYATYEYCVRSAVQATLLELRTTGVELRNVRRDVLALILDSDWNSAADAGRPRVWDSRIALLAHVDSRERTSSIRDDLFPSDGSHYRVNQLRTIWKIFGIPGSEVAEQRHRGRIEELVENRNAISHGRRTAEDVGSRYSWQDVAARIDDTDAICRHLISTLQAHVQSGGCLVAGGGT